MKSSACIDLEDDGDGPGERVFVQHGSPILSDLPGARLGETRKFIPARIGVAGTGNGPCVLILDCVCCLLMDERKNYEGEVESPTLWFS